MRGETKDEDRASLLTPNSSPENRGGVAQLGEHLLCKQGVIGSIPFTSTSFRMRRARGAALTQETSEASARVGHFLLVVSIRRLLVVL